ncbi:hypothetical protein L3Y34_016017 [Caenorhabditis briggsae]|uniref:Uncharacterized protein n=1 Tax=Caenorhabditis briggsae TaxID=6238 RepID=A0AAE9DX23_CAEBR|nr:hypothetical protein L3Y34_016017 [Caenorhabditis briggsae]
MLILLAYMKVLLLFLYFLPNNVGGCLVVKPKNPDLQNCKCSIDLFNQDDIRNNNGGSYLANQKAWNPIVTATDSCGLSITCDPIAGVSSFMTVMFRSNGNPLYLNRVVSGQSTYLHNLDQSITLPVTNQKMEPINGITMAPHFPIYLYLVLLMKIVASVLAL